MGKGKNFVSIQKYIGIYKPKLPAFRNMLSKRVVVFFN